MSVTSCSSNLIEVESLRTACGVCYLAQASCVSPWNNVHITHDLLLKATRAVLKGLLHGYEWGLRFGGLELRFG